MTERDDFTIETKRHLALRAGYRCSNPTCRALTAGPSDADSNAITNIGVAAHINAASKNGPRFCKTMSHEERSAIENGIWLCQNHAKEIDDDPKKYTENCLHAWKEDAERSAREEIGIPVNDIPFSVNIKLYVARDEHGFLIAYGQANLPNYTKLLISLLESSTNKLLCQDHCVIRHGAFSTAGFSNRGSPLGSKRYKVEVASYFNDAWQQSDSVLVGVGKLGRRLLGPQVMFTDFEFQDSERYINAIFDIAVGQSPIEKSKNWSELDAIHTVQKAIIEVNECGLSTASIIDVVNWFMSGPGLKENLGWSADRLENGVYEVNFSFWDNQTAKLAKWSVILNSGEVRYENIQAKRMSYLPAD